MFPMYMGRRTVRIWVDEIYPDIRAKWVVTTLRNTVLYRILHYVVLVALLAVCKLWSLPRVILFFRNGLWYGGP